MLILVILFILLILIMSSSYDPLVTEFENESHYMTHDFHPDQPLSNDDLLLLYGYFKQATIGDVNIPEPGMFSFREKAKWNAWFKNGGLTKSQAMELYIETAQKLRSQN